MNMRTTKQMRQRKRVLTIVVIIIIAAMALAYVLPMTTWSAWAAPETPPPEQPGADYDYDDSQLPAPWEDDDEEDDTPKPMLRILSDPIRLDVNQTVPIQYELSGLPDSTLLNWATGNVKVAVVTADGVVKGVGPGDTEVIVTAEHLRASLLISVNELRANEINIVVGGDVDVLGPARYEVTVGDVIRLSADLQPAGSKVDKFEWKLGNKKVATISPNFQTCEFVATAVGETQVSVTAGALKDAISFNIKESGVPIDKLWEYIQYIVIIIIIIVVLAVVLTWLSQKRKKEKARQKALAAKRRREEAERRAREEARDAGARREKSNPRQDPRFEPRPAQSEERETLKISGTAVGAGIPARPKSGEEDGAERPVTLDDLN